MGSFGELSGLKEWGYDCINLRENSCWPIGLTKVNAEENYKHLVNPDKLSEDNYKEFNRRVLQNFKPLVYDELVKLIPEWQRLAEVNESWIEMHTYRVTYLTWIDPRLAAFSAK